jgi:hypothetical protein
LDDKELGIKIWCERYIRDSKENVDIYSMSGQRRMAEMVLPEDNPL